MLLYDMHICYGKYRLRVAFPAENRLVNSKSDPSFKDKLRWSLCHRATREDVAVYY